MDKDTARFLAIDILSHFEIHHDFYFEMEDWLTDMLSGNPRPVPSRIYRQYLKSALRVEVKDLNTDYDYNLTDEDVDNVVDNILSVLNLESVLNHKLIERKCQQYACEQQTIPLEV